MVGVAGVPTLMNDRGRPRDCARDLDGKCIEDGFGVVVMVRVDGVLMAVGEGGNTKSVWDSIFIDVNGVASGSCVLRVLRKTLFRVCRDDEVRFRPGRVQGKSTTRCTGVEIESRGEDGFDGLLKAVAVVGESTMIVMGDDGTVGSPMGGGRRLATARAILKLDMLKAVLCTEAEGGT